MRTKKIGASSTDWFYYDGQMPIETAEVGSSSTVVTRNGLGARGIDRIERVGTSTTVGYPIYDGHGNMIATLSKSGSSYSVGDLRSYDAWGGIRSGNTTGDPKSRYCAKLGHVDDDESGLTYMRARYYESGSGRFVSEDFARDGWNYVACCNNDPQNQVEQTGNSPELQRFLSILGGIIGGAISARYCDAFKPVFFAFMVSIIAESLAMVAVYLEGKKELSNATSIGALGFYAGIFPLLTAVNGLATGSKGFSDGSDPARFWQGYAAMLLATLLILNMEVEIVTGG